MKKFINNKFLNRFDERNRRKLYYFFDELNDKVMLTNRDRKLFVEDFEDAITYYLNHDYTLDKALEVLSIDNLGTYYKNKVDNWYPLDNAAKIYPLSMKESWMSVFRLSYYFKEDIVPEILQIALSFTIKRFPTFRTSIRKGFFWHYIDGIKKRFSIYRDKRLPCSYINVSNIGKPSFKVVYYKNRVSVEYFHIITDGYGGIVFLSTLVAEYLRLLGKKISYNDIVLNIKDKYSTDEISDEFPKNQNTSKTKSLVETKALDLDGKLSNVRPCQLLHFDMNINEIKKASKNNNCSVTEFILAIIFMACSYNTSKEGSINIQVPVNMRKYYPSNTLRNFSLYVSINIKKSEIINFNDTLENIKKQMKDKITKPNLDQTLTYSNKLVNSLKYVPLFIKRPIASLVYGYLGDKVMTTVLSNLGNIDLPVDMKKYIEKMDFSLGTGISNRALFSLITCNDVTTLSISKFTTNRAIENSIYNLLKDNGISVDVYGSDLYGSKK